MAAISGFELKRPAWQTTVIFTLAFWLSSSLILDLVIMPGLYATGMMTQSGFATAGYSIFWIFNRIELLCAALVLTGLLAVRGTQNNSSPEVRREILLSAFLLAIALIYTYILTPEMSALGLQLNLFSPAGTPAAMTTMHEGYWVLEALKLIVGGTLLSWCYRHQEA
jgi:hypothetical protein